ncbi:hypothetical protein DFP93_102346 [Aneurinibacillus soli]|uniref:Uncharacterized protein n=1 Tax=Aneurinibacillus soli TaxID=1500254 RepID=A0A0U5AZH0_9BACL|nr:SA1362 family protein [Aneurinibacillus soli]PYE63659.1 hypothetical protein DFP93_102346 [Aneurinibacillus soli]BAU27408.1 hypothetical protein CB4_01582 [Aneurinibacillus soli]
MARKFSLFSVALLALVGVGFASELYNNPAGLIRSILITVAIAGVLYFLFTRFMASRGAGMSSSTDKGYERALRQQKQRNKKSLQQSVSSESAGSSNKLKKTNRLKSLTRRDHPFKVIEGKKNKSGNRSKTS